MENVLNSQVLVLNKNYQPITTTNVITAISKLWAERVEAISVEEDGTYMNHTFSSWAEISELRSMFDDEFNNEGIDWIHSPSLKIMVPRVIRLLTYDKLPKHDVRLTRKSLYKRDKYVCQYCGHKFSTEELTIEHIVPRSKGGRNTWENLVAACIPCNRKKGNKDLEHSGMKLIKKPKKPNAIHGVVIHLGNKRYKDWDHFISDVYWNTELQE